MNTRLALAALAVSIIGVSSSATGASYVGTAYEPFDYGTAVDAGNTANDGNINANSGGFGFNSTGDPTLPNTTVWGGTGVSAVTNSSVVSGSLSGASTSGNKLTAAGSGTTGGAAGRGLGQSVDAGTFYFSFLTDRNNASLRTVNFALFDGTNEKFSIGQYGTATAGTTTNGNFAMVFLNTNPANLITSSSPIAYGENIVHLVIGRIDFNANGTNERVRIYIDPVDLNDETSLTPYLDNSSFNLGVINAFRPFAGGTATGFTEGSGDFDEIRFGSSFSSVAVPEPTSTLCITLGGVALFSMRRARRFA